jgi:lipopolysaccharide export system permease protein
MTRIDRLVLRRLGGSIFITLLVILGIVALVESLDLSRFRRLDALGGPLLGVAGIAAAASHWLVAALPLVLLVGAVAGLLDMRARGETTIIKASGLSVWRLMRAPLVATLILGPLLAVGLDTGSVLFTRAVSPARTAITPIDTPVPFWIDQTGSEGPFVIEGQFLHPDGRSLDGVTVFLLSPPRDRIEAASAELVEGAWRLTDAVRYSSGAPVTKVPALDIPTDMSFAEMRARLVSADEMTATELGVAASTRLADPALKAEVTTRLYRLLALPLTLGAALLIAFAFTAGYRRSNKYGVAVLYGIVLGFVVYVLSELSGRAGGAGLIAPSLAAFAPPIIAVVAGVTVLLNREDGRT